MSRTTLAGREAELGAGEQIGHGLRVVDRAVEILEGAQLATAVDAAGGVFRRCARGLIGIDADEQGALGLRNAERPSEQEDQGRGNGNKGFHTCSNRKLRAAALRLPRFDPPTDSRAWLAHRGRTTRCKVIQARGPENRSTSYRLKHCPSGEVAHPVLQEKGFVTASSLRFFDVKHGTRVSAEVSCR